MNAMQFKVYGTASVSPHADRRATGLDSKALVAEGRSADTLSGALARQRVSDAALPFKNARQVAV
jgi:hypothetical protein